MRGWRSCTTLVRRAVKTILVRERCMRNALRENTLPMNFLLLAASAARSYAGNTSTQKA
jgi:hypothetical protein